VSEQPQCDSVGASAHHPPSRLCMQGASQPSDGRTTRTATHRWPSITTMITRPLRTPPAQRSWRGAQYSEIASTLRSGVVGGWWGRGRGVEREGGEDFQFLRRTKRGNLHGSTTSGKHLVVVSPRPKQSKPQGGPGDDKVILPHMRLANPKSV